jgi:hypothetical protein
MASDAILHDGRVFPQIGAPCPGMALKTLQVDILGIYQFICNGPMRVVTIHAFYFSLPDRVVGLSHQLGPYAFVALGANLDLGSSCEILGMTPMDTVTFCA